MYIEKHPNDKNFPFIIGNSWNETVSCTRADLEQLKDLIANALGEEPPKSTSRIATAGSIGGQMVRKMIEAYERKRR